MSRMPSPNDPADPQEFADAVQGYADALIAYSDDLIAFANRLGTLDPPPTRAELGFILNSTVAILGQHEGLITLRSEAAPRQPTHEPAELMQ